MEADEITPELACTLLALPRTVGVHPESTKTILDRIECYDASLQHGVTRVTLPDNEDVLTVAVSRALSLVDAKIQR